MKITKGIAIFFGTFLIYHIAFSPFFPVDDNNVLQAPDWYAVVGFSLSVAVAVLATKKKRQPKQKAVQVPDNFSIPRSEKAQTELASDLLSEVKWRVSLANKSCNVSTFVEYYDQAIDILSKLMQLKKVSFKNSPALDYYALKDEFQLHLCDAIARAKDDTVSNIRGKYRNSVEFQERACTLFMYDIDCVRSRFSEGTACFADKCIAEVQRAANYSTNYESDSTHISADSLAAVDLMEGHEFEHWCAELLRKNGFSEVEVTPGSGDQGVDIVAVSGGIRFAIQCKCYSSNLGNTPVQEVNAGKQYYRCQIGVVMTNSHFTKSAKELASITGVLLWDRDKLQEFMQSASRP